MQNTMNNVFRVVDENIRPGNTPTDLLIQTAKVTGNQASEKIKVPFQVGTKLAYVVMNVVTVDSDNEITVVTTGSTAPGYVQIMGKSMNLMVTGDAL